MAIRCLFFTPKNSESPCQVLQALAVPPLEPGTQLQLQARYCQTGAFIACPIFSRMEASLVEANRLRDQPPQARPSALPSLVLSG